MALYATDEIPYVDTQTRDLKGTSVAIVDQINLYEKAGWAVRLIVAHTPTRWVVVFERPRQTVTEA